MKIVKSIEDSVLLIKGARETVAIEEKAALFSLLLITLGASLLGNMLTGQGLNRAGYSNEGHEIIRAGYGSKESSNNKDSWCHFIFWLI